MDSDNTYAGHICHQSSFPQISVTSLHVLHLSIHPPGSLIINQKGLVMQHRLCPPASLRYSDTIKPWGSTGCSASRSKLKAISVKIRVEEGAW